jgi:SAM-dependent methyltransferase
MSVFGLYSRYYDLLYRDKDYVGESGFVLEQLKATGLTGNRLLELGCGTGMHATRFAAAGCSVQAIDMSTEMLAEAETRRGRLPAELGGRLAFAQGDLRTYRDSRAFDAVLSLFHVFSYQTTNADLQAAFATAAVHLQRGSLLAFDFWYGPAVLHQRPEVRVRRLEDEHIKVLRIAESTLHANANRVDVRFTVFVEDKQTGQREELRETHPMRYLFLPEIDVFLERAGFERVKAMEWMKEAPLGEHSWSGFVVARKISGER